MFIYIYVYLCPDYAAVLHDDKGWQVDIIFDPGISI